MIKEIVLPPLFAKILTEPSLFPPEQKIEVNEFIQLNELGNLISIHYRNYEKKVIGKFTESPDVPSPYTGLRSFHVLDVDHIEGLPVYVEVPTNIEMVPESEYDAITSSVGLGDETEGEGTAIGPDGEKFEYKWWAEDKEWELRKISVCIIMNKDLIADFDMYGLQTFDHIESCDGALLFHNFDRKAELESYEMGLRDAGKEFRVLCDLPGNTPISFYTNQWWNSLTEDQRYNILDTPEPSSTNTLWLRMGEELRILLFNILKKDTHTNVHVINLVCHEIAIIKVLTAYEISIDDILNDRSDVWPFYKSKIKHYTNKLNENIMQDLGI